jgi:hypothetical protein
MATSAAIERVANRSLKFPSVPPPGAYTTVDALPGLTFTTPIAITSPPGDTNRLFICERAGVILVVTNLARPTRSVFLDLTSRGITQNGECGLLGLAFHPGYATNGYLLLRRL